MIKTRYLTIVLILTGCCNALFAQQLVPAFGGGADLKDFSAGFSFSYVSSEFKIQRRPDWRKPFFDADNNMFVTDSLNSISSKSLPGFAVGFLARYRLTDHLEVRTNPSFVFADRSVSYKYKTSSQDVNKLVQTTTFDVPFSVKLKSDRVGNVRAYLLGGMKLSTAIGSKKNTDINSAPAEKLLKNNRSYASYEAGFGFDIYFEYFKLSPEIKLSNSLGNILVQENHPYAAPISSLSLHTILFSLIFE